MVFSRHLRGVVSIIALVASVDGFVAIATGNGHQRMQQHATEKTRLQSHQSEPAVPSSKPCQTIQQPRYASIVAAGVLFFAGSAPLAIADDTTPVTATIPTTYSIEKCSTASKSPCVSTSNVRQLDLYSPPWTFPDSYSADEIMSRLKGAVVADSSCDIVQQDGNQYLVVQAKRPADIFGTTDRLEFVVNSADQVVTFRSSAPAESTSTDFGLQRKRLDEIRRRAGVFGVMGENMNTADSATTGERGNGPLGQLKAFYGLQSGGGFEDVLAE
jgi:uncharacterized protein (DUF1499 family)